MIDARTGTVVIGQDVQISTVAVTYGTLNVKITEAPQVSQPAPLSQGKTTVTPRTQIDVEQGRRTGRGHQRLEPSRAGGGPQPPRRQAERASSRSCRRSSPPARCRPISSPNSRVKPDASPAAHVDVDAVSSRSHVMSIFARRCLALVAFAAVGRAAAEWRAARRRAARPKPAADKGAESEIARYCGAIAPSAVEARLQLSAQAAR